MAFNWGLINDNVTEDDKQKMIEFIKSPNVRFTNGANVKEFEKKWSDWLGVKHSVFINSGASANYICSAIVRDLYGKGEVIVPSLGWVSNIASLVNLGHTPVFVDVSMKSMGASIESIREAYSEKTRAISLIHLLGFNCFNDEIRNFADSKGLMILEDCCESHGAKYNDMKVGTLGDISCFSFYFGHHMTSVEGGMICTDDDRLYELSKLYRSHGMTRELSEESHRVYSDKNPDMNPMFTFAVPGFNFRNTEINAVLGINQLKRLDKNIQIRTRNFNTWIENLNPDLYFVDFDSSGSSNFALPLILKNKNRLLFDKVCEILKNNKVEYRIGTAGGGNQSRQPYLTDGNYSYRIVGSLKNVNHIHSYGLYIGNHTEVSEKEVIGLCFLLNSIGGFIDD